MADKFVVNATTGEMSAVPLSTEELAQLQEDESQAGERAAVDATRSANSSTLMSRAVTALTDNATFLDLATPTNAQVVNQVEALTRQCSALIRLQLRLLDAVE